MTFVVVAFVSPHNIAIVIEIDLHFRNPHLQSSGGETTSSQNHGQCVHLLQ